MRCASTWNGDTMSSTSRCLVSGRSSKKAAASGRAGSRVSARGLSRAMVALLLLAGKKLAGVFDFADAADGGGLALGGGERDLARIARGADWRAADRGGHGALAGGWSIGDAALGFGLAQAQLRLDIGEVIGRIDG